MNKEILDVVLKQRLDMAHMSKHVDAVTNRIDQRVFAMEAKLDKLGKRRGSAHHAS